MPIGLRLFRCTTRLLMCTALSSDSRWLFRNQHEPPLRTGIAEYGSNTLHFSYNRTISLVGYAVVQDGRKWTIAICMLVCMHIGVSLVVPRSFVLTAFGDILQNLLLCLATVA